MSESSPKANPFLIPLAIVIAGAMVSGTLYFTRNTTASAPAPTEDAGKPSADNMRAVDESDWVWGSRDADIVVVEYSDLQCPFCDRFHPTMERIVEEYQGKVVWVYRHFPLEMLHSEAVPSAIASECAGEIGGNEAFWKYINKLFEYQTALGRDTYLRVARENGLDEGAFTACLAKPEVEQRVREDMDDAAGAGGEGTPFNIVVTKSGKRLPFSGALPYQQVKTLVDRAIALNEAP